MANTQFEASVSFQHTNSESKTPYNKTKIKRNKIVANDQLRELVSEPNMRFAWPDFGRGRIIIKLQLAPMPIGGR